MIFTIFTSCQLAARRGGEGRPKGGRANELTTTTAGDRIVWANRTAVCAADAAAAAAATRELLLVLLLLLMMMRCCPPAMTTTAKTTILRGGTHNTPKTETQAETETETETTLQTGNVWHTRFTLHTGAFCVVWCWFLYDFYQTKPIKHSIQSIYMWKSKRELLINPEATRHATADASCAVGVNVSSARQQNSI